MKKTGVHASVNRWFWALSMMAIMAPTPVFATFPGENGRIAYTDALESSTVNSRRAVFVTGSGQLTVPRGEYPSLVESDSDPAWSPGGVRVAFVRSNFYGDAREFLMIVNNDGSGLRQIISSDAFPRPTPTSQVHASFHSPTFSRDGRLIAFVVRYDFGQYQQSVWGIWTVSVDGSGLTQLTRDPQVIQGTAARSLQGLDWSPGGNEIVYPCSFRLYREDLCAVDSLTGMIRRLPIDPPDFSNIFDNFVAVGGVRRPRWSPDGEKIVFVDDFVDIQGIRRSEIFSLHADGTGLAALTNSLAACSNAGSGTHPRASMEYLDPVPSPDGTQLVVQARKWIGTAERCTASDFGLWTLGAEGGHPSLLVAEDTLLTNGTPAGFIADPEWQSIFGDLVVTIEDGHNNPLHGLKVELRTLEDGTLVDAEPINTAGGVYVFEQAISPGDYLLSVTLTDKPGEAGAIPSFDIRYAPTADVADEPAWIEARITLDGSPTSVPIRFADSTDLLASSVPQEASDKLDDLANIYFRVRQYVDWVKTHLTADTGQTVEFYTFATVDPFFGFAVAPSTAYYHVAQTAVVMSTLESDYENRDGVTGEALVLDQNNNRLGGHADDAPENSEWHEFSHHLYGTFVSNAASCASGFTNHAGYNNPDTCDSMDEGFAAFLPTWASQDIDGTVDASYDNLGYNFEHVKYKAWGYRVPLDPQSVVNPTTEEFAVAGLLWDLLDTNADVEAAQIIGADRLHHASAYHDQVSIPLRQFWNQVVSAHVATVRDLRNSFGTPALSRDLDNDGTMDVAPVDEVFLMHGFFPIHTDQTITDSHKTYHYDVASGSSGERNSAVGLTSHVEYDSTGAVKQTLIPRSNVPAQPRANLEVHVLDASGNPLSGATLNMTIRYPDGREQEVSRRLATGDGAHVHLELPPYFDYLLPSGAPLPACDPAHDFHVQVTLNATVDGITSPETSFDNCTYQRAMAAGAGSAALSVTLTVPIRGEGRVCDVNGDDSIDRNDISLITAARNQAATGPTDPRDPDRNGVVNVLDARQCTLRCDLAQCAVK